jgi:hypothetical protein
MTHLGYCPQRIGLCLGRSGRSAVAENGMGLT